jgi:hypothetical protein
VTEPIPPVPSDSERIELPLVDYAARWWRTNRLNALKFYTENIAKTKTIGEPEVVYVMSQVRRLLEAIEEQQRQPPRFILLKTIAALCLHPDSKSPDIVIPILEKLSVAFVSALQGGLAVSELFQNVIPDQLSQTRLRAELSAFYQEAGLPAIWQDDQAWKALVHVLAGLIVGVPLSIKLSLVTETVAKLGGMKATIPPVVPDVSQANRDRKLAASIHRMALAQGSLQHVPFMLCMMPVEYSLPGITEAEYSVVKVHLPGYVWILNTIGDARIMAPSDYFRSELPSEPRT